MKLSGSLTRLSRLFSSCSPPWLRVNPEVQEAVSRGSPVVALETAILTHGLPFPLNLETSLALESIIRDQGVLPATVGLLNGRMCVGLTESELEFLANHPSPCKVSRRDVPRLLASPRSVGGTTVSGTMLAAHAAGISVFATGGIGGVHRGAESTWDVSADLVELGRTPVCVVCAGAKSILDLPRTLEVLETQGVCVMSMQSDFFPAFYLPSIGLQTPNRVDSVTDAALVVDAMVQTGLNSGVVLAVPIPEEEAGRKMKPSIETALREAEEKGIKGQKVTPFLLDRIAQLSEGESVRANLALVKNNALIGAQVAKELSKIRMQRDHPRQFTRSPESTEKEERKLVVVGGSNVDFVCTVESAESLDDVRTAASYPGRVLQSCGGVGRNLAEVVARLGATHCLLTALGNDDSSNFIRRWCPVLNLERALMVTDGNTAQYTAILNAKGELMFGVGDMKIHESIDSDYLLRNADVIPDAHVVIIDGNVPISTLHTAADLCRKADVPLWFEPTDVLKASNILQGMTGQSADFASPNIAEFEMIYQHLNGVDLRLSEQITACQNHSSMLDWLCKLQRACEEVASRIPCLLIKLGSRGVFFWDSQGRADKAGFWCCNEDIDRESITSVSGCGDSLVGAFVVGRWVKQWPLEMCLQAGMKAAEASLETSCAINSEINHHSFSADAVEVWGRRVVQKWL